MHGLGGEHAVWVLLVASTWMSRSTSSRELLILVNKGPR